MQAADWIWLSTLGVLLASDAILFKTGRPLLTDEARKHKIFALGLLGVFALHIIDVLGPLDPFRALGHLL